MRLYEDSWEEEGRLEAAAQTNQPMAFSRGEEAQTENLLKPLVRCSLVEEQYDREALKETFSLHQLVREFLLSKGVDDWPEIFRHVQEFRKDGQLPSLTPPTDPLAQMIHQLESRQIAPIA